MSDRDGPERADELVDELTELVGDPEAARRALDELREHLVAPLDTDVTNHHLDAMVAATGPNTDVIDLRSRRARRAITGTVIGALALVGTGGLAAAGHLPGPVQDTVSRIAGAIAIDIPRSTPGDTVEPPTTPGDTAPGRSVDDHPRDTAPGRVDGDRGRPDSVPGDTAPGQQGPPDSVPGDTAPGQPGQGQGQGQGQGSGNR